MARIALSLVVMALAVTIFAAPLIFAASEEENAGQVLFLERGQQEFLRGSRESYSVEDTFSQEDIAASVSVLLGVPPPFTLGSASSAKLDTVISSNPFKRPHSVLALTVSGISLDLLSAAEKEVIFGPCTVQQRRSAGNRGQEPIVIAGDVDFEFLNNHQQGLKQGLKDLSNFLGGVLTEEDAGGDVDSTRGVVLMTVPLVESVSVSLDLSKEADRKFAMDLLSVYDILKRAGAPQDSRRVAKLYTSGRVDLKSMENNLDAAKIFLLTAVKVLNGGQIVGVFVFDSSSSVRESGQEMMFRAKSPIRSRSLDESSQGLGAPSPDADLTKVDSTLIELETIALVRTSLVVATAIILLVATLLGTCYLVGMPLTRDTLLYSGVKLD